jgi:hypothetical protein
MINRCDETVGVVGVVLEQCYAVGDDAPFLILVRG